MGKNYSSLTLRKILAFFFLQLSLTQQSLAPARDETRKDVLLAHCSYQVPRLGKTQSAGQMQLAEPKGFSCPIHMPGLSTWQLCPLFSILPTLCSSPPTGSCASAAAASPCPSSIPLDSTCPPWNRHNKQLPG